MIRTSTENRRYRLHQKIKRAAFRYASRNKTVYVPANSDLQNNDVIELKNKHGYCIQLEIPTD
ncbi:hypothetical protein [Flavobacterium sp.]|uniref:hypothetical protein n=1 Tax=Flavobacterium sp. TaxID=239 RepID=UPI002B4B2A3C|nr:hypothetical protein [Flavobacterium sp.]HLF51888.1 hypothetical protein [Flavobacterium sp.]